MSAVYKTIQGDTWDGMAYKFFGDEKYMENLIKANWPLADVLIFSSGTEIIVPDIEEEEDVDLPVWRQASASSEDST